MISDIIIQPAYFAPIVQYAAIIQSNNVHFEVHDHFIKQTYRTRCYVYGANGKLLLNVPVNKAKGEKSLTPNVEINYSEDWQKLHLKSLQSAYRGSPFYEYYEDELLGIFENKYTYLWELQEKTHAFVMDALQETRIEKKTTSYIKDYDENEVVDLRSLINAKKNIHIGFSKYIQMFDEAHGFIQNLSILDLIFMEGPNASLYLEKIKIKD